MSRRILFVQAVLTLVVVCAMQVFARDPHYPQNTGVFKGSSAPLSPTLRFWASDAGKRLLLHSPSPMAVPLLKWFHPEALGQYPQQPLLKRGPMSFVHRDPVTVTGCGTVSGTVMNLEPAANAVTQSGPMVDFLLSALGSGKDLVAEYGYDGRSVYYGEFDSASVMYVHRDPTVSCYGGTDFEMGNPPIPDPFNPGNELDGVGGGRIVADPGTSTRPAQFIFADIRFDYITSGIGLRRIPATNFESTSTCPAGTLTSTQEATCAGTNGIIVDASEDNIADAVSIAQDPRATGTGAGDIYVVSPSERVLRSVILLSACKGAFTSASDCSSPIILNGSLDGGLPSVAVVGGGPNAGAIVISFVNEETGFQFVSCTPAGAPNPPVCANSSPIYTDSNLYTTLTDNPGLELTTWPVLAARTDTGGQTLFLAWSDCKGATAYLDGCPEAQIVMTTATSLSSPAWTFHGITGSASHHILPSVAYDSGQDIVTLTYYSTSGSIYKNAVLMAINQFPPGSTSPGATTFITSNYDSLQGNGSYSGYTEFGFVGIGDYVGTSAHGGSASGSSRLYVGFTNNARQGTYSGISNTQADNNVSRVTY